MGQQYHTYGICAKTPYSKTIHMVFVPNKHTAKPYIWYLCQKPYRNTIHMVFVPKTIQQYHTYGICAKYHSTAVWYSYGTLFLCGISLWYFYGILLFHRNTIGIPQDIQKYHMNTTGHSEIP